MKGKNYKIVSLYSFFLFEENLILDLKNKLLEIGNENDLSGLLIFASEGINGTICAEKNVIDFVINLLNKYAGNRNLNIKVNFSKEKVFKKLKIKIKKEIVTMGVPEINPAENNGTYIDSADWNKLIKNQNTIVIDTRNHYEVSLGTFQNSINPNTRNFSEFPQWVDDHLETHLENKQNTNIAMFCTGGIRCEKATSLLKKKGYKNIYHLQGGILQYLDDVPKEKNLFEGECYVFDKRVSLDQDLEKGSYSICHACGMPISIQDQEKKEYRKGIQCHFCIDQFSDDDRKRFEERQKQIDRLTVENQNTIVIDTRNHYEVSLGTFQNSIYPNTRNFSEFPKWVDDYLKTHLENKQNTNIAMFCTGGIRCEKATSLLKKKGYKNIYHLQGGILQYLELSLIHI